jgi:hypothetical protein
VSVSSSFNPVMPACRFVSKLVSHSTHATAPGDTDRGRGVPPVVDRPAKTTFYLPISTRAWRPSIGSRRPSSWPVSALPVRHGRRRVRVRPPSSLSLWGKPQVPSPCKAKGLAAVSQARSKATKSIPCALGRVYAKALHGGVRSGDDDVTRDDGVTHTGTRSQGSTPFPLFFSSAHVTAGRPHPAATSGRHRPSRETKRTLSCHRAGLARLAQVQAAWRWPQLDVVVHALSANTTGTSETMMIKAARPGRPALFHHRHSPPPPAVLVACAHAS